MTMDEEAPDLQERPWVLLNSTDDVEAWIERHNRDLQSAVTKKYSAGHGICFHLQAGGEIYLQTNGDGDILLDVTPDAAWVGPLITAASGVEDPQTQFWGLPGDRLVALMVGLNVLIAGSQIVLEHRFGKSKMMN